MPLNIKAHWKPIADVEEVLEKLAKIKKEDHFLVHFNRMRYEEDPLHYQPTATCRTTDPEKDHHVIRFPDIEAEFIFRLDEKDSLNKDDLSQNQNLKGCLNFIKCLLDGE